MQEFIIKDNINKFALQLDPTRESKIRSFRTIFLLVLYIIQFMI